MAFCATYEHFEWIGLTVAAERDLSEEDKAALESWYSEAFNDAVLTGNASAWPSECEWPEWERIIGIKNPFLRTPEVVRIPIKLKKAGIPVDLRLQTLCQSCNSRKGAR